MAIRCVLFAFAVVVFLQLVAGNHATNSLVLTMLCRDEDVNLKSNLASWLPFVSYFVFVMDTRTNDGSEATIRSILGKANKDFVIVPNNFTGFGQARTLSLQAAWKSFPHASHVLISDPDWVPRMETINLNELDGSADVFRFTIYDAPRDGQRNRRSMDWLLRHKEGLAMQYHLHEVLSISEYKVKKIGWVVDEVEKKGTWHSTVGHSNSVSADRYKFDLELLYKDLAIYGHDPHVHYYLGITHESFASKAMVTYGSEHPEIQQSIDQAIRYLTLRATSTYDAELLEQRWGALIELGNIYTSLRRSDTKAMRWLNMCYEYNPNQIECALLLCQLYRRLGQLKPALQMLHKALMAERGPDRFSAAVDIWDCDLPAVAADLIATKAQVQGISAQEAMHFFVLLDMTKTPHCSQKHKITFNRATKAAINAALGTPNVDYFQTKNNFCSNALLHAYLLKHQYTVHPCDAYREARAQRDMCDIFTFTSLPAYEEQQLGTFSRQFLGAAILPDIAHHAFQGHLDTFLMKDRPLRFLFAEHFHPEMVLNLLGQLQRQVVEDFEIVVVSPESDKLEKIKSRMAYCRGEVRPKFAAQVKFVTKTLVQYVSSRKSADSKFDYIEYNGGISKAVDPAAELKAVQELLLPGGVVGMTYFAENRHVSQVRQLVDRRNTTHMVPFSMEATRLVHNYLEQHKLGLFKADRELVTHLGGEASPSVVPLYRLNQLKPRAQWRTCTQPEVEQIVASAGLHVASWVPTAYARPFDELQHYEVQKYRAMGLSQDRFVREILPNFRYTTYLIRAADLVPDARVGRLPVDLNVFVENRTAPAVAASTIVVDRLSTLGQSFASMESLAERQESTTVEFAHYALPDVHFAFIVSPIIAPCLPHISSRPTIQEMHQMNVDFARRRGVALVEVEAQKLLLSLLSYLEKLNLITFEHNPSVKVPPRTFKIETVADRSGGSGRGGGSGSANQHRAEKQGPPGTTKVGGLNVKTPQNAAPEEQTKKKSSTGSKSHPASSTAEKPAKDQQPGVTPASADSTLSFSEQVSRMRSLGYSDDMIEQLLGESVEPDSTAVPDARTPPAQATAAPEQEVEVKSTGKTASFDPEESSSKARGIIDLLKRFTQQRAAEAESKAKLTSDGASASLSLNPGDQIVTPQFAETRQEGDKSPAVTFKMSKKTDSAPSNLVMGGGLKLPQHSKEGADSVPVFKQAPAAFPDQPAVDSSRSAASIAVGGGAGRSLADKTGDKQQVRPEQIKMPTQQTITALQQQTPRSLDCIPTPNQKAPAKSWCVESKVLKRKTAQLASTSARKSEFDLAQLQYIQAQRSADLSDPVKKAISKAQTSVAEVAKFLTDNKIDGQYKVVKLANNPTIQPHAELLNRAYFVDRDAGIPAEKLVHSGAMQYLRSIRDQVEYHDYLVVDVILQDAAMAQIGRMLLSSTVWFDATNGAALASHHDEGLVFKTLHTLVQQVAMALSETTRPLKVNGYYTLAMNLQHEAHSPVFMANKDDFNVVLWLNPTTMTRPAAGANGGEDGLRIYNEASAGKLFSQGVSVYPSSHSDFLSRSSSLAIDLAARCNTTNSEFVPRSPNRLVVVRSKKLCTLLTPGNAPKPASFEASTMIALVMVLSPST